MILVYYSVRQGGPMTRRGTFLLAEDGSVKASKKSLENMLIPIGPMPDQIDPSDGEAWLRHAEFEFSGTYTRAVLEP
jgi:hypothetical protein